MEDNDFLFIHNKQEICLQPPPRVAHASRLIYSISKTMTEADSCEYLVYKDYLSENFEANPLFSLY